jgi:hypothetical protein
MVLPRSSACTIHSSAPESGREARLLLHGYFNSFSELNNGELRGSVYTAIRAMIIDDRIML